MIILEAEKVEVNIDKSGRNVFSKIYATRSNIKAGQ